MTKKKPEHHDDDISYADFSKLQIVTDWFEERQKTSPGPIYFRQGNTVGILFTGTAMDYEVIKLFFENELDILVQIYKELHERS